MSKKKLPNLLNSRLDSLLLDLEHEAAYLPTHLENQMAGWAWECDSEVRYISCGPEVEPILGLRKEDFIGQPLGEYALNPASRHPIDSAVNRGLFPAEVRVVFQDRDGKSIPALLQFLSYSTEDKATGIIRGFVQIDSHHLEDAQAALNFDTPERKSEITAETGSISTPLSHLTPTSIESFKLTSLRTKPSEGESPAVMSVPFRLPDKSLGLLEILDDNPDRHWTSDERKLVEQVADHLSQALEMAYLYQETNQRVQELDLLFGVSQSLSGASMDPAEIGSIVATSLAEVMDVPRISVLLLDTGHNIWKVLTDYKWQLDIDGKLNPVSTERSGKPILISEFPDLKEMISNPQPVRIGDQDTKSKEGIQRYMQLNDYNFLLFLPLTTQGQLIGAVEIGTDEQDYSFTNTQLNLSNAVANAAAVALENARLYEAQRKATEKLREVDKLKSQFLANMSHELRTPLNSIIGFSRVILKGIDGPITEHQQQDLNAIHNSGTHLLNLINNVLDISKIDAGKMELVFEDNIDLAILIESVIATTKALVKDKPVYLETHIQPDLPLLRLDPTRIRQVMLNLLSNAAKFTEKGNIILDAHLQIGENGRPEVIVKVSDSGIGIAPENQYRLFQPFSQVDESPTRKAGGSGLGLSISRLLIEMHGGRIGVSSDVGAGSTFFFTLPIPEEVEQKENKTVD